MRSTEERTAAARLLMLSEAGVKPASPFMTTDPKTSVANRAHIAFHGTPRFKMGASLDDALSGYESSPSIRAIQGTLVGVYENPRGTDPSRVLITDSGIATAGGLGVRWIPYSEMTATRGPANKQTGDCASIMLRSGVRLEIRIAGEDGELKDVFGFVRFISRVLEDRATTPGTR
jgi:hypothetical protein